MAGGKRKERGKRGIDDIFYLFEDSGGGDVFRVASCNIKDLAILY